MKKRTVCAIRTSWVILVLAGMLCLPAFTGALTLSAAQVQLHNYVGAPIPLLGDSIVFFEEGVPSGYGNGREDQAYWWNSFEEALVDLSAAPSTKDSASILGSTGVASGTSFEFGEIFEFGQFRYTHQSLFGELLEQINLMPSFTIDGVSAQESADFVLSATNKDATGMDFTFTTGPQTLNINGDAYNFEFGFESLTGGGLSDTFHVSFNAENRVKLLARISAETAAVPEPGTIALFGMGLLGLLGIAGRRRKKA